MRKSNHNRFIVPCVLTVFVLISAVFCIIYVNNHRNTPVEEKVVTPLVEVQNQPTEQYSNIKESGDGFSSLAIAKVSDVSVPVENENPGVSKVSFVAVGDNIVHSSVLADAKKLAEGTDKDYNFVPMFENIREYIEQADIAYINQESPMAGEDRGYSGYPMFNAPDRVIYDLKEIGFDVFNIANNHMLDRFSSGYERTVEFMNSQTDITTIGGYVNEEDYNDFTIIEKDGIKIALLAYTYGTNGINPDPKSQMVIPLCDASSNDVIDRQTREAREIADIVIVSIHWGNEHWFEPSWLQEQQMEIMVENNVDVILGSHPHVLEPMFWKDRPDGGRTLVVYSLSNILSGMNYMRNHLGGIAGFDIYKVGDKAFVGNASFIPTVCHFNSGVRQFKLHKLSDYTEQMLRSHGTQIRGTDSYRDMEYLYDIVRDTIPDEFLVEDFYKSEGFKK